MLKLRQIYSAGKVLYALRVAVWEVGLQHIVRDDQIHPLIQYRLKDQLLAADIAFVQQDHIQFPFQNSFTEFFGIRIGLCLQDHIWVHPFELSQQIRN